MNCSQCKSERIIQISGKCGDLFSACQLDTNVGHVDGIPDGIGLSCGSDYIQLKYCLECGQIQNWTPQPGLVDTDE